MMYENYNRDFDKQVILLYNITEFGSAKEKNII